MSHLPQPKKEGLDSALEFTKFLITLDGALIAFVTGATFVQDLTAPAEKIAALAALILLMTSIIAGIFVYMAVATMQSAGDYDLTKKHLRVPGIINVIGFGLGAGAVAVLAAFEIFLEGSNAPPSPQTFEAGCTVAAGNPHGRVDCSGQLGSAVK